MTESALCDQFSKHQENLSKATLLGRQLNGAPAFILNTHRLLLPSSGFTQNKSIIYRNSALADKLLYSTNPVGQC